MGCVLGVEAVLDRQLDRNGQAAFVQDGNGRSDFDPRIRAACTVDTTGIVDDAYLGIDQVDLLDNGNDEVQSRQQGIGLIFPVGGEDAALTFGDDDEREI